MRSEHCRLYGHHWKGSINKSDRHFWYDDLLCQECGTRAIAKISKSTGASVSRSYSYPKEYKLPQKMTRAELRKEVFGKRTR